MDRSFNLRNNAEEALDKYAADLRVLADNVELNLHDNIAVTQKALQVNLILSFPSYKNTLFQNRRPRMI